MKRTRAAYRDEETWERGSKQPRPQGTGRTQMLVGQSGCTLSDQSSRTYGDIVARDEATVVAGDNYGTVVTNHNYPKSSRQPLDILLESLVFDRSNDRLLNIAEALSDTCQWLFKHPHFVTWKAASGLLWIKGKPGSGKSTIMKEVHRWAEETWPTHRVLSYFFNARSPNVMEKSPLGLYRSLMHQLLSISTVGHGPFISTFKHKIKTERRAGKEVESVVTDQWTETELQNSITELFRAKEQPPITFLVDALDEGQDDEVRSMIRFLERLTRHAETTGVVVRICLSSRHYPSNTVQTSLQIVVEEQRGQREDIETYISHELVIDTAYPEADVLRHTISSRSNGIFLWAVLVIKMLNKIYDQGKGMQAMWQKLASIPTDLHKLFADLLSRDSEDMEKCVTLLQWVLFSEIPMQPDQLYRIMHYTHREESDTLPELDEILKYLLNCSRGLIELTKTSPPFVQFIHETVRSYLLNADLPGTVLSIDESAGSLTRKALEPAKSHGKLAETCLEYILDIFSLQISIRQCFKDDGLLSYAARAWHRHARKAREVNIERVVRLALCIFKDSANFRIWIALSDLQLKQSEDTCTPLHCAALIGIPPLVSCVLPFTGDIDAVHAIDGTALCIAAERGYYPVVQILLNRGADLCRTGGKYGSPLSAAAAQRYERIVKLLLDNMTNNVADIDPQSRYGHSLYYAAVVDHAGIVQMLLDHGASPNAPGPCNVARQCASVQDFEQDLVEMAQDLLHGCTHSDAQKGCRSPLLAASFRGHAVVRAALVQAGARLSPQEEPIKALCETEYQNSGLLLLNGFKQRPIFEKFVERTFDTKPTVSLFATDIKRFSHDRNLRHPPPSF